MILRDGVELRHVADTLYVIVDGSVLESFPVSNLFNWLSMHGNILSDRYHPVEPEPPIPIDYSTLPKLRMNIQWSAPVLRSPSPDC